MACNIEKATNKINSLQIQIGNLKRNLDLNQKLISELETVKEQLAKAKQLKLEENKDNKNIESEKYSIDEIISNVYNENNKLQKIGTKEQYLDYVKNKINDSSAKTLLYYGTPIQEKIEKPKQSSSGKYGKGVYLTDSFEEAKLFAYTKEQKDIFGDTNDNELPFGQILAGYTAKGNSIEAKPSVGDNDFIEFPSLNSLITEPSKTEQIRKENNVNLIIGDNGKYFTPSKEFVVNEDSLVLLGSLEDVKSFKSNIKTSLVNNNPKTKENKDNKNNIEKNNKNIYEELKIMFDAYLSGDGIKIGGGYVENSQVSIDGYKTSDADEDIKAGKIEKGINQEIIKDLLPKVNIKTIKKYQRISKEYYENNKKTKAISDVLMEAIALLESIKSEDYVAEQIGLATNNVEKVQSESLNDNIDKLIKEYLSEKKIKDKIKYEINRSDIYTYVEIKDLPYYFNTSSLEKYLKEKTNNKNIKIIDYIIQFSVQQVLEQYKKDENIEKENVKLLDYIQNNVKFEMNYSKQLAYDFFTGEGIAGNYDWKDNVVTIADFDGLRNDKEMMKMLSIEQVNQDTGALDIKTASTQINMIIDEVNKRNIDFTTKLHESVHAAVYNYMRSPNGKEYNDEMTRLYEIVKQAAKANPEMFKTNKSYWAKDVDEFLAEALSKPELIKDLMKIDLEGNLITGAEKSMFDKIIDIIVEALGLSTKEDKLNMHKYLLDSFKAAVEANRDGKAYKPFKAPDRDVKNKYKGKIILVNSGGGKSYASKMNNNIVDGDSILVESANEITKELGLKSFINNVSDINDVWISWGKGDSNKEPEYNKLRNKVYELQAEKAKRIAKNGKTVLIASARKPILDIVDYVMFQNNVDILFDNLNDKNRENPLEFSKKDLENKIKKFEKNIEGKDVIYIDKGKFVLDELVNNKNNYVNNSEGINKNKNKYKTISEEDIMQAKDIMLKNKEECR